MKTFLIGILCFFLGIGAFYGFTQYQKTAEENKKLIEKLEQAAKPTPMPTTSPDSATPDELMAEEEGSISGKLGYPSEGIPPLLVYAIDQDDDSKFFMVETATNQATFTIEGVAPGTYGVVAYVKSAPTSSGAYTKAVPCGLTVSCTDHSLIPVVVTAGEETTDIDVRDWYAPEGTFPNKPN